MEKISKNSFVNVFFIKNSENGTNTCKNLMKSYVEKRKIFFSDKKLDKNFENY